MGNHKYIDNPETFENWWEEYKAHIDANPDKEEVLSNKGDVVILNKPKPYLRQGFEAYVWKKYRVTLKHYIENTGGAYEKFCRTVSHARNEWEEQTISGTLTGRFKAPNLVARLHNIAENNNNKEALSIKILNIDPLDDGSE